MTSNVLFERGARVAVITIDRPAVRNAVDGPTALALERAFLDFDADATLDVAVLAGAAGSFCAGADLRAIAESLDAPGSRANPLNEDLAQTAPMGCTRLALSKPVIAAIEGHAVAGGLELALWCDLRVAAEDAVLGVFCRRWGVPLIDGGTVRLPRLIGESRALDLILTGRAVNAAEALHIGLVNRIVPRGMALEAAIELALQIAAHPQTCLRNDRASALAQAGLPWREAMRQEFELGRQTLAAGQVQAGGAAFLRRRARGDDREDGA
ncbi:crotonase/enoyl-CoA hydratase family protein [Rivibacter subsaxonicus]|uniref:Enoyl-CoA hydratase n=1 Tax=Rivibacter subsaxonicus TaxID=457575 RepID=A0A4V2FU85_9BURK|nr:crotonase/enoyl-CoA hydratase family protein [Rivibacter subsaxonicus]RZU00966.1 enoyl-CoA hydratase [Rivibacter subsaxonicus]